MERRVLALLGIAVLSSVLVACDRTSNVPTSPTAPAAGSTDAAPDGATLKVNSPTPQSPVSDVRVSDSNPTVLTASPVTTKFGTLSAGQVQYRFLVFGPDGALFQDSGLVADPSWTVTNEFESVVRYTWKARAEYEGAFGPWSSTGSFISPEAALVKDPLTNGRTVGIQRGGYFIPGRGWMSDERTAAIDYDIPTCNDCTLEFDITNIGKGEGICCTADLSIVSMADAGSYSDFGLFRDSPWKMQVRQRADGDGTGFELIWRNGAASEHGNPGDHRIKFLYGGPDYQDTSIFHFVVHWTEDGYDVAVGQDGATPIEYMADGFGGIPYEPPNHRISLGCYPRAESFQSAIYSNVKVKRNQ